MRRIPRRGWPLIVILIFALLTFAFPGCAKKEAPTKKLSLEEILERIYKASEEVKTCKFDGDINMEMGIMMGAQGEAETSTISMKTSGAIDQEAKKMKMECEAIIKMSPSLEEQPETLKMEIFYFEDAMYTYVEKLREEMPMGWTKRPLPEGIWEQRNQFEQQIEILKVSEATLLPDEEVNGTPCYVLELKPNPEKIWEITMSQEGISWILGISMMLSMFSKENMEIEFKTPSVKYWIEQDSFLQPFQGQPAAAGRSVFGRSFHNAASR